MSSSRVSHACRACAKARVKCEETKPCSRCRARNITCQPSISAVAAAAEIPASTTTSTPLSGLSGMAASAHVFEPGGPPGGHGRGHDHPHPLLGSSYQPTYGQPPQPAPMIDPALTFHGSYPTQFSITGSSTTGITSHAPMPYTTTSAYAQPAVVMNHVTTGPGPNSAATSATAAVTTPGAPFSMAYYSQQDQQQRQQLGLSHAAVPGFGGGHPSSGAPGAGNSTMGRFHREPYAGLDGGWPTDPAVANNGQGAQQQDMSNVWAFGDFDLQNLRHW